MIELMTKTRRKVRVSLNISSMHKTNKLNQYLNMLIKCSIQFKVKLNYKLNQKWGTIELQKNVKVIVEFLVQLQYNDKVKTA